MNIRAYCPLPALMWMIALVIILGCDSLGTSSNLVAAGGAGAVTITTQPECASNASSPAGWPGNLAISASGGTSNVSVSAMDRCTWGAASNAQWITFTSPAAGTGTGSVTLSVARNSSAARVGDFTVAGQTFTITQDAAGVARGGNRGDDDEGDDGGGSGRDGGPGKDKDKEKDIALEVIR